MKPRLDPVTETARVHADVGKQIHELMEREGLSTRRLAQLAGVDPGRIRDLRIGKHSPSLRTLACLFAALGYRLEVYADPNPRAGE